MIVPGGGIKLQPSLQISRDRCCKKLYFPLSESLCLVSWDSFNLVVYVEHTYFILPWKNIILGKYKLFLQGEKLIRIFIPAVHIVCGGLRVTNSLRKKQSVSQMCCTCLCCVHIWCSPGTSVSSHLPQTQLLA